MLHIFVYRIHFAEYEAKGCAKNIQHSISDKGSYFELYPDISLPSSMWTTLGMCWADKGLRVQVPYQITVEFYSTVPTSHGSHPGLVYSVQDDNSFDFVYFR